MIMFIVFIINQIMECKLYFGGNCWLQGDIRNQHDLEKLFSQAKYVKFDMNAIIRFL